MLSNLLAAAMSVAEDDSKRAKSPLILVLLAIAFYLDPWLKAKYGVDITPAVAAAVVILAWLADSPFTKLKKLKQVKTELTKEPTDGPHDNAL